MRVCDICRTERCGKQTSVAMERRIPFEDSFTLDMCDAHWSQYMVAIKLATTLFRQDSEPPKDTHLRLRARKISE